MTSHAFDVCVQGRGRAVLLTISLLCASAWTFAIHSGAAGVNIGAAGFEIASATTALVLALVAINELRRAKTTNGKARGNEAACKAASACALACGFALCVLTSMKIAAGATAVVPIDIMSTAFVTLLAMMQFATVRSLEHREMVIASAVAFSAAAIGANMLQPESMPQQVAIAALPLVAGITLAPCLGIADQEAGESAKAPKQKPASEHQRGSSLNREQLTADKPRNSPSTDKGACGAQRIDRGRISRPAAGFCAMMFVLGFAHDNARIGYLSSIPGFGDFSPTGTTATYAFVVVALIGVITWLSLRKPNDHSSGMRTSYHVAALTLATSQLLPLLPFDPATHATVILPVHMGVFRGMLFFVWITTLQANNAPKTVLYCLSQAALSLGSLTGVGIWDIAHAASASDTFFYPLMLISTLGLVFAYVVLFTDENLDALMSCDGAKHATEIEQIENRNENASGHGNKRFSTRCEAVAQAHGLTPRETEIMMMFAKGRNLDYIHASLVISKSTVSMHRQHIYRKLDVHSQQEMIDLIEHWEVDS